MKWSDGSPIVVGEFFTYPSTVYKRRVVAIFESPFSESSFKYENTAIGMTGIFTQVEVFEYWCVPVNRVRQKSGFGKFVTEKGL